MLCPICSSQLTEHQGLFRCPANHGTLVTGKYLSDIEEKPHAEAHSSPSVDTKHAIQCPHCSKEMHKVDYNSTDIIIDACTNCHYRWLDTGEIRKIKDFKPDIKAKDLLFIFSVDEQIRKASKRDIKEANPRLPLQGSYRAGAEVVAGISGDHRTRLGAIFGQGFYGIYRGLTHSKTSRWLTIITLLIFGLLFYFIFLDAKSTFGF